MESRFYNFIRPILTFLFKIVFKPNIIGIENIPNEGKIIIAGNHTNMLDCILVMCATKRQIHFLAKDELWKFPQNIIFSNLGLIPVNRKTKDSNCLKLASYYLNNELVIGIFPEGTRNKTDKLLLDFKFGAVSLASKSDAYIIPFAITGDYCFRSKNLKIEYSKPFKIGNMSLEQANEKLTKEVKKILIKNIK